MDYEEEQKNEIEALESIYFNELKGKESIHRRPAVPTH